MTLDRFENLLKQTIGLDSSSVGPAAIERAVRRRISACRLDSDDAYWALLSNCKKELQELVEAVVVPETWFFRDHGAFAALARMAHAAWLRTARHRMLRLLSLPCSTGEEPYSMAMALLESGLPAHRFRIDAVDISAASLAQARRAVYGKNSFRESDLGFRDRHFAATTEGFQLCASVRQQVHFEHGNLFDSTFCSGWKYDVIFCRNVLIYFNRTARDAAISVLMRRLETNAVLFVAPSEAGLLSDYGLVSCKLPRAFAFQKTIPIIDNFAQRSCPPVRSSAAAASAPPPLQQELPPPPLTTEVRPATGLSGPEHNLEEILRLADHGHLAQAADQCNDYLRLHRASADIFHLLGLISDACGKQSDAVEYYRKALYLDPNHYQTLVHLTIMRRGGGDVKGARQLAERLRRLDDAEKTRHA